jgi:hypothetical protein
MRKFYFTLIFFTAVGHSLSAQVGSHFIDVLLFEPVVGDPLSLMLPIPSGNDLTWINYDGDMGLGLCAATGPTPHGWYVDKDFSVPNPADTDNDGFTSCSYLSNASIRNDNWLILPPLYIPDSSYQLCWRSLTVEAPAYMDGYKVLASKASNLPSSGDFSTVLFTAAETVARPLEYTLNLDDFVFSEGYIHANSFTDTNYFYLINPEGPYYGRLEPHCVSLANFAAQTIYLAFLHDSKNNSQIQIDDILINNDISSGVQQAANFLNFNIIPNPAVSNTYVKWTLKKPEAGVLRLYDLSGKLILEKNFSAYEQGQIFIDLQPYNPGVYQCTLQTPSGQSNRKLVKL